MCLEIQPSPILGINLVINHDAPTEMLEHTVNILKQRCKLQIMAERIKNMLPLQKGIYQMLKAQQFKLNASQTERALRCTLAHLIVDEPARESEVQCFKSNAHKIAVHLTKEHNHELPCK